MNRFSALLAFLTLFAMPAIASDRGSLDEAKLMATKTATFLKDNSAEKAFPVCTENSDAGVAVMKSA